MGAVRAAAAVSKSTLGVIGQDLFLEMRIFEVVPLNVISQPPLCSGLLVANFAAPDGRKSAESTTEELKNEASSLLVPKSEARKNVVLTTEESTSVVPKSGDSTIEVLKNEVSNLLVPKSEARKSEAMTTVLMTWVLTTEELKNEVSRTEKPKSVARMSGELTIEGLMNKEMKMVRMTWALTTEESKSEARTNGASTIEEPKS
jgi:hypothetical protein